MVILGNRECVTTTDTRRLRKQKERNEKYNMLVEVEKLKENSCK